MPRTERRGSGRVRSPSEWLSPFLTPFTVTNEKDFAACGRRPKGSALWTSASWAQLDQL
ncbi:MAG: hypothetical protein K2J11_11565 [Oscillospiraceae bacterium]|nr:hypothetical protein [Oscillospiraceae bacterium]